MGGRRGGKGARCRAAGRVGVVGTRWLGVATRAARAAVAVGFLLVPGGVAGRGMVLSGSYLGVRRLLVGGRGGGGRS